MTMKEKEPRSSKKKIGSIIYNCVLIFMVVISIIFIINRINNRTTFIFDRSVIVIATGSMEPVIPTGSCILISRSEPEDIKAGDIITFYSEDPAIAGNLNTHRVVGIEEGSDGLEFETKGDNNIIADEYTAKAGNLVGKYVKNLPVLTAISSVFLSKTGFFIIILAFVVYSIVMIILEILKNKKSEEAKKKAEFDRKVAEEIERLKNSNMANSNERKDRIPVSHETDNKTSKK